MLPQNLKRSIAWVTFVVMAAVVLASILLVPGIAHAAILPACENHPLTPMPAEWLAAPAVVPLDACVAGAVAEEDQGDPRVAAMCDDRGASVVAPPRILPVVDARIDAPASCGTELGGPQVGPAPNDSPLGPPAFATAEPATMGGGLVVPPASSELAPPFVIVEGAARRGVTRGIEHPPR